MDRDEKLLGCRPQLKLENIDTKSIEKFQNETLRPILKFQHGLTQSILLGHPNYESLRSIEGDAKEYRQSLKKLIQTNIAFKNQLLGIIIGQFTSSELQYYLTDRKEINKRILQMQLNRYCDTFTTKGIK